MLTDWIGVATLVLTAEHPDRSAGFLGGFTAVAVRAQTCAAAAAMLENEFEENKIQLNGFEWFLVSGSVPGERSEAQIIMLRKLDEYPVQFWSIHLHKGDG